jgi:hypothetical protein
VIFPYQEKELYMSFQAKILKSKSLAVTFVSVVGLIVVAACTDQSAKAKPNLVVKDPPRPGVVAKINGDEITEEQLIGDDKLDFFDLKKREYDLKMERLNKLMEEKFIGADAKKAGMSTQDYINKKLTGGDIKISDKDYKKFVAEKHIPEAQINDQVKERRTTSRKRRSLLRLKFTSLSLRCRFKWIQAMHHFGAKKTRKSRSSNSLTSNVLSVHELLRRSLSSRKNITAK